METTYHIQQSIKNSSHLDYIVLRCVASACGVSEEDISTSKKDADISRAKNIYCIIMSDLGFSHSEIQKMLGIEYRSVQRYVSMKSERLENDVFKYCYHKAIDFINNNHFEYASVHSRLVNIELQLMDLESKYNHLKQLILN